MSTPKGHQEHALRHGHYKTFPNHVVAANGLLHYYCPPDDVPSEVTHLLEQLTSDDFGTRSPALQAAYAHHAFVAIHPFPDGNGRVARALASLFLYRAVGLPLVIFADQRERYWDVLKAADHGEHEPMIRFIEDRTLDTMALVSARLREASQPSGAAAAALRQLFTAHSGLTFTEVEACGQRLTRELRGVLDQVAAETEVNDVRHSILPKGGKFTCDFTRPYHTLQDGGGFTFNLDCAEPVAMHAEATPIVGVADSPNERFAFIVMDANRPAEAPLRLRIDDLHPGITLSGSDRINAWMREVYDHALGQLHDGIKQTLKQQGFAP